MEQQAYSLLSLSFILAALPLLVGLCTSYLKVQVVLSSLRSGLGTQNVPSAMVVTALSLAITVLVMNPVIEKTFLAWEHVGEILVHKLYEKKESAKIEKLVAPWKQFMLQHTGKRELLVLTSLVQKEKLCLEESCFNESQISMAVLVPAFVVSELKQAFAMGFVLLLPFVIVDVVVANILVALGMYMVSPVFITLPIKMLLFVSVDGWLLLTEGLIQSYGTH